MLTAKQIKHLPKGTYPNHELCRMFPKQQGPGKSARYKTVNTSKDGKPWLERLLINAFTGQVVKPRKRQKK